MDNKKLLKFLYKDIAEIEELVSEKGSEGFDEFEIEFIQSRFTGAKQLIQILSEKENKQLSKIRPRPVVAVEEEIVLEPKPEVLKTVDSQAPISSEEKESLEALSDFEEELKEDTSEKEVEITESVVVEESEPSKVERVEERVEVPGDESATIADTAAVEEAAAAVNTEPKSNVQLEDEELVDEANHRLGDSFSKEKSVNELLGNVDINKLEYKISNSPVESIKAAIGINDRYQYIRELFEGSADNFAKAVGELDNLNDIQEAVNYLQQNYKWKKNDTSLKFVNLVKRRFPNGK